MRMSNMRMEMMMRDRMMMMMNKRMEMMIIMMQMHGVKQQ